MGTRVDFYVGRGEQAEWLGSYPFDGYPDGVFGDVRDNPELWDAGDAPVREEDWRAFVASVLAEGGEASTTPDMGWPWPWETSATTDYAYAWDEGTIYGSSFGDAWFQVDPTAEDFGQPEDEDDNGGGTAVFPDMTSRMAATLGPRSGVIVIGPSS